MNGTCGRGREAGRGRKVFLLALEEAMLAVAGAASRVSSGGPERSALDCDCRPGFFGLSVSAPIFVRIRCQYGRILSSRIAVSYLPKHRRFGRSYSMDSDWGQGHLPTLTA